MADKKLAKVKATWKEAYARADTTLPKEKEICIEESEFVPWKFNDIIGFLDIRYDLGRYIMGYISLKLKNFPKNHYKLNFNPPKYATTIEHNQIFPYTEVDKTYIEDLQSNASIIKSINELIKKAEIMLRKNNRKWNIDKFPAPLSYINFVKLFKYLNENTKKR